MLLRRSIWRLEPGGWRRDREVVADLCLEPTCSKFIAIVPTQHAVITVAASLAGTHPLARLVDASAAKPPGGPVRFREGC